MAQEYNVNFIWDSLSDFWKLFEDSGTINQLWRGYIFTVNNLYYQLYQLNLSKCIHTIPYEWISDYEVFIFDNSTRRFYDPDNEVFDVYEILVRDDTSDEVVTVQDYGHFLYPDFPYAYALPYGVKNVSDLRESPRETVELPHNTMMGPDNLLVLPDDSVRFLGDEFYLPEEVIKWDDHLIFPKGISVPTKVLTPNVDYIVDEDSRTIHFKTEPYNIMWSNFSVRDLGIIYDNFGSMIKFYKPDSYKYLREVQGIWFAYWNGASITNIEIGLNILRDLPFVKDDGVVERVNVEQSSAVIGDYTFYINTAQRELLEVGDVVTFIDSASGVITIGNINIRLDPRDAAELEVGDEILSLSAPTIKTTINGEEYIYSGESTSSVYLGEFVPKFMPLTNAIKVYDYINYPGWWLEYTGTSGLSEDPCALDGSAYFDSNSIFDLGIFDASSTDRCLDALFMQYFTFLVKVDQSAWFCTKSDLDVVIAFLHAIKPAYTHFLFELVINFQDETTVYDHDFRFKNWEFRPTDIPINFHRFDMEHIHPTFDDGDFFDSEDEIDRLCISVYGSPNIFTEEAFNGYTFDDVAVPTFDYGRLSFDSDPFNDTMDIEWRRKPPSTLEFGDDSCTIESNCFIE